MSYSEERLWLVCYDVRSPRRLQRLHHYLEGQCLHLQYSVFGVKMSEWQLRPLLGQIAERIDLEEDDVRVYPVPSACDVTVLGEVALPRGVTLPDQQFLSLLRRSPRMKATGQTAGRG